MHNTKNEDELNNFSKIAKDWEDPKNGSFSMLYKMNNLRIEYIKKHCKGLANKKVLDIGCGGGILAERLSENKANVTAIDPCDENIEIAKKNSKFSVNYLCSTIEELENQSEFDIICIMEVLEHVENLPFFIKKCSEILKPGGKIFFSTINRTKKSYLFAILFAEYALKLVPKNTHSWQKFITPAEIFNLFSKNSIKVQDFTGMKYNILLDNWNFDKNLAVNYIGYGTK